MGSVTVMPFAVVQTSMSLDHETFDKLSHSQPATKRAQGQLQKVLLEVMIYFAVTSQVQVQQVRLLSQF